MRNERLGTMVSEEQTGNSDEIHLVNLLASRSAIRNTTLLSTNFYNNLLIVYSHMQMTLRTTNDTLLNPIPEEMQEENTV